jgi:drug/metabolite transporter (DMT)-like permease
MARGAMTASLLPRLAPPLFVLIWATGFVAARLVAPYADPLTFLSLRFAIAALVLALAAAAFRAPWPATGRAWRDGLVAGALLHGIYLGGVFWAVKHGLPAGIAALIAGLQPLATGLLVGPWLGERVSRQRWIGIAVGALGAALVVAPKLGTADGFPPGPLAVCILGMLSITVGTIWQKRTSGAADLRTNAVVQYLGALLVTGAADAPPRGRAPRALRAPVDRARLGGVRPVDRRDRAPPGPDPPRGRRRRRGAALPGARPSRRSWPSLSSARP